jgi:hypothetical protein
MKKTLERFSLLDFAVSGITATIYAKYGYAEMLGIAVFTFGIGIALAIQSASR